MKERPILFSAPMVRAIRAGRKTQTRRIMKPQPGPAFWDHAGYVLKVDGDAMRFWDIQAGAFSPHSPVVKCPYGVPGDRLWAKEAWETRCWADWVQMRYLADHKDAWFDIPRRMPSDWKAPWRADQEEWERYVGDVLDKDKRRPSIHMPRWASRILLEVVSVRVERVEAISEADAISEGVRAVTKDGSLFKYCVYDDGPDMSSVPWQDMPKTAREAFLHLFYGINERAQRGSNPWVRAVEFKVIGGAA